MEIGAADADYVLRWLEQSDAPENIIRLQRRALDLICDLLSEREFGPQLFKCPDPTCKVLTTGVGYDSCPGCGGALVPRWPSRKV